MTENKTWRLILYVVVLFWLYVGLLSIATVIQWFVDRLRGIFAYD